MAEILPNKEELMCNFSRCYNWEQKYLYIIDLGNFLPKLPINMYSKKYFISGCQSKVWIVMIIDINGSVQFYGDSDAAIVKGLISIIFIIYQKLTPIEIINFDIYAFFDSLLLKQHLTFSRSQGLDTIIKFIHSKITTF